MRLTRAGLVVSKPAALARLRAQFKARHYVRLPGLLDRDLLGQIQAQLERATFYERVHEGIGRELGARRDPTVGLLHFLTNDGGVFDLVRQITGCARIGYFHGRIYRFTPGRGDFDGWHDDLIERRMVALSINLSPRPYQGGILKLRDRRSRRILGQIANVGPGNGVLFRLSPALQHKVTPVTGTAAKTAYAGWFRARPDFQSLLVRGRRRVPRRPRRLEGPSSWRDRLRIPETVAHRPEGARRGLYDLTRGFYHRLDEVGNRWWMLLTRRGTVEATANALASECNAPPKRLRRDLLDFVHQLRAQGLVEVHGA